MVTYSTVALPVGLGRHFLRNSPRAMDAALGNWNLSVIQTIEQGAPFGFTQTGASDVYLPRTLRPDMAPGKTYVSRSRGIPAVRAATASPVRSPGPTSMRSPLRRHLRRVRRVAIF